MGSFQSSSPVRPVSTILAGTAILCAGGLTIFALSGGAVFAHVKIGAVLILMLAMALREVSTYNDRTRQAIKINAKVAEIEETNRLLSLTETYANVGHWRLDAQTDKIFWSDGTFALHGVQKGQAPALEDAIDFYAPEDRAMVASSIESAKLSGEPYSFRARLLRADGEKRDAEVVAHIQKDAHGATTALFGVIRDRTDEERMQANLRDARDQAHALADAKTEFLAKMSHEIRTPMNGVVGFAQLLAQNDLSQQQRRHVDLIIDSSNALQTLLTDILDFSSAEAGEIVLRPEPTDLLTLIDTILNLASPTAHEKSIKLTNTIAADTPRYIHIDALRLRQIISNLLSNAMRFTDSGSVHLELTCTQENLNFTVHDTGVGIQKDMQTCVFEPFTQDTARETTRRGGTGLGLAICRHLAGLMGGRLTLESQVGFGSSFTLTLPLEVAPAPTRDDRASAAVPNAALDKCASRILLVEDFDINQELIGEMVNHLGVELDIAEDGLQAQEMVIKAHDQSQPYALILMDLQMPVMGGIEAAKSLRKAGFHEEHLPIVALSANAFEEDVQACLDAGMQAHLAKPISLEDLRASLSRWLSGFTANMPADCRKADAQDPKELRRWPGQKS